MSIGAGPSAGGGLMVAGSGGSAFSPTDSGDPLAPILACANPPGNGPGDSCSSDGGGGGGSGGGSNDGGSVWLRTLNTASGNGGASGGTCSACGGCQSGSGGSSTTPNGPNGSYPTLGQYAWTRMYYPLDLGGTSCLPPPDPGTSPEPMPGPGSAYAQVLYVQDFKSGGNASGLSVTCLTTGATETTDCGPHTFYFDHGGSATYQTPGGAGIDCFNNLPRTYQGNSMVVPIANNEVFFELARVL